MSAQVLIVEDDPIVAEHVETTLLSLGHQSCAVASQAEALAAIETQSFELALLDLQIPALPGRGGADIEFGVNLLHDIRQRYSAEELPVLIMTSHVADCLNLVGKLKQLGANEFIAKPFQTKGWTLSRAVSKLLKEQAKAQRARQAAMPQRFAGGELHLGAERVTLCGATVLVKSRSPLMCAVLEELSDRNAFGDYVSLSGPELAERLKNQRGSNAISSAVSKFRARVIAELAERYELTVGSGDVIQSRGSGYRLNEWICVSFAEGDACGTLSGDQQSSPATTSLTLFDSQGTSNSPMGAATNTLVRTEAPASDANQCKRRQWIVAQLRLQRKLRTPDIARELGCSVQTIRLDIESLRQAGRIEFVGAAKSGYYRPSKEILDGTWRFPEAQVVR